MGFPIRTTVIAAASLAGATALAAELPALDVSRTCTPMNAGDKIFTIDRDRCFKTEREAREELVREWSSFPAADQTLCTRTATVGGMESYVHLITCLEMRRAAARLPDRAMTVRPAALPKY
jgi:hypothetical protein